VSDRRRFSPEGEPLDEAAAPPKESAEGSTHTPAREAVHEGAAVGGDSGHRREPMEMALPEASFELLVVSLGMQARMELGPGGDEEGASPNLDLARHTIDLLAVLQQKTKGNLTLEESRLLENSLTELRFRYVQRVEEINQRAKT